ncbi:transglycosylase family protein [Lentzea jiangxiensis]|uniref:LysM domain-containing protein n=1 Tax=Lentzea jiangxiensis TaxID=641025 RepID=A0A1H0WWD1_9PSEU|nr:transglycosylase family protein [Lentzea jiangxiensis]SDP94899.1 LysM domain-containing protein [Lentzea jiangxiensis]
MRPLRGTTTVRALFIAVSAAALVTTGAAVAAASPSVDWDRIAQCESGNNWSTNTGNGYYGGLQFSPSTWKSHGGTGSAHQASREEQIRVAERVLRTQGLGAWGVCGRRGGTAVKPQQPQSQQQKQQQPTRQGQRPVVSRTVPRSVPVVPVAAPSTSNPDGDYEIKAGDTLSGIAEALRIEGGWQALVAKNSRFLTNPDLIKPGHKIATK